jgi:hypothetical protein
MKWIPFNWETLAFSGEIIEKAAITIPVTIDELPQKFTMQFDLGAPTTCFYEKPLKRFLVEYPFLNNKLDTTKKFLLNGKENPFFKNVNLHLDEVIFDGIDVGLLADFETENPPDCISSETETTIGTIGSDLFQNKILIIDFKLNRLAITDALPDEYQNASFENFKINKGRIKIPFRINGKTEDLMFDTGSSAFSLITTKQNALEIGGNEIVYSLIVPSWGQFIPVYGLETAAPVAFGDKKLGNTVVYYSEYTSWNDFYKSENIWGVTGNALFFNDIIIIDYKNNRFGVR